MKDYMMSFIAPTYYQNRHYKSFKDASLTEDQVVAIYDTYVWLMADKEVANRFNFESVESKEEFLVYLKFKKMTHNEFFSIHCKIFEGSFLTEKKCSADVQGGVHRCYGSRKAL